MTQISMFVFRRKPMIFLDLLQGQCLPKDKFTLKRLKRQRRKKRSQKRNVSQPIKSWKTALMMRMNPIGKRATLRPRKTQ